MRFYPTLIQNELNSIPYSIRIKEVDRVGFEPTTSANNFNFMRGALHHISTS
jgi:hypothetical protein